MFKSLIFKLKIFKLVPASSSQSGFTLVEIIIYMGLVSLLIGGAVIATSELIASQKNIGNGLEDYNEALFILGKIDWALSGAYSITQPSPNGSGAVLSVYKTDFSPNPIIIDMSGDDIRMKKGVNQPVILNNSWSKISNLNFVFNRQSGSFNTDSIIASFDLNGKTYSTTRLISK